MPSEAENLRTLASRTWKDGRSRRLALAQAADVSLGDPWGQGSFSFAAALRRCEHEIEPTEPFQELVASGYVDWTVPIDHGGQALDVDETFLLARILARRDQAVAGTTFVSTFGFLPIWVGGTSEQKTAYGSRVLAGDRFSLGLSELAHGSDVLAGETTAALDEHGSWRINGSKQSIGNSSVARFISVFCRTSERPGPGAMSFIVVDRLAQQSESAFTHDRPLRMHGLQGFAVGNLRFADAIATPESAVGGEGRGLEILLQSAQIARSLITCLPLGGADTSLRAAMDFVNWHSLFGERLRDVGYTRAQLAESFARLIFSESANLCAIRGTQAMPEHAALLSSTVKYAVPPRIAMVFDTLTEVLGARHYYRDHPRLAFHVKAMRDGRVAHFADGNAVVNLKVLASALGTVLPPDKSLDEASGDDGDELIHWADYSVSLPPFTPWRQSVAIRRGAPSTGSVIGAARRLDVLRASGGRTAQIAQRARADLQVIWDRGRGARRRWEGLQDADDKTRSSAAERLRIAEIAGSISLTGCAAAAWAAGPDALGDDLATLAVFALGLALEAGTANQIDELHDEVFDVLDRLHREERLFSVLPVQLTSEKGAPSWI